MFLNDQIACFAAGCEEFGTDNCSCIAALRRAVMAAPILILELGGEFVPGDQALGLGWLLGVELEQKVWVFADPSGGYLEVQEAQVPMVIIGEDLSGRPLESAYTRPRVWPEVLRTNSFFDELPGKPRFPNDTFQLRPHVTLKPSADLVCGKCEINLKEHLV